LVENGRAQRYGFGSMSESSAASSSARKVPEISELFFGFLAISLSGFGGVLPWARRTIVEQRRWLTEREFVEVFALCQFLPGPNIVNLSIIIGSRFRGIPGALASFAGLVVAPLMIMMSLGALYARFGDLEVLRGPLAGLAAAAAGLIVAVSVKMAMPLVHDRKAMPLLVAAIGFVAVGLFRLPLYWVVLVLAPLSIAWSWWVQR
jgi:chromate transporter